MDETTNGGSQNSHSQYFLPQPESEYPVEVIDLDHMNALAGKNISVETAVLTAPSTFTGYVLPSVSPNVSQSFANNPSEWSASPNPVISNSPYGSTNNASPSIKIIRASPNLMQPSISRGGMRARGRGRNSFTGRTMDIKLTEAQIDADVLTLQKSFPSLSLKVISRVYSSCIHNMNRATKELKRIEEFENKKKNVRIITEEEQAKQRPLVPDSVDINSLFKRVICQTDSNTNGRSVGKTIIQEDVEDTEARINAFMSNSCVQILPSGDMPRVASLRGPGRPRSSYRAVGTRTHYPPRTVIKQQPIYNKLPLQMNHVRNGKGDDLDKDDDNQHPDETNEEDFQDSMKPEKDLPNSYSPAREFSTNDPPDSTGEKKFFRHKRRFETNNTSGNCETDSTPGKQPRGTLQDTGSALALSHELENKEDIITDAKLLAYINESTIEELCLIPHCSLRKAKAIERLRPFATFDDFNDSISVALSKSNDKSLQKSDSVNAVVQLLWQGCRDLFSMRITVNKLLKRCEAQVAKNDSLNTLHNLIGEVEMTPSLINLLEGSRNADSYSMLSDASSLMKEEKFSHDGVILEQPGCLNPNLSLKPFQIIGLNWLRQLHSRNLNGILADEMGLGKTIQSIAFLAYLLERRGDRGPHLIIVPTSTLQNWARELNLWCPSLSVVTYVGSQEERKDLRLRIYDGRLADFNVLLTTYHIATSSIEDRSLIKRINFHYGVFDEAHMLKNMVSQRYRSFMNITVQRRLLLTGTPLQNNFQELFSLLTFLMPDQFGQYVDSLKKLFSLYARASQEVGKSKNRDPFSAFEIEKIEHAKTLLRPFFLRRLKTQVLHQLPTKVTKVIQLDMLPEQQAAYENLLAKMKVASTGKEAPPEIAADNSKAPSVTLAELMQLRKAANHPLLLLQYYTEEKLRAIAQTLVREDPQHAHSDPNLVFEDLLSLNNDFSINLVCKQHENLLSSFMLPQEKFVQSAKFAYLDSLLPDLHKAGDRVLLFSQFLNMLDILEEYLQVHDFPYIRMDGQTPSNERQNLIDHFNNSEDGDKPFIFLLSTRAGGMGINLTAANVVIMHDIDFNPHNDRQAEDRAHRVGQTRDVRVFRLLAKGTIEEAMYSNAEEKMKLGDVITGDEKVLDDTLDSQTNSPSPNALKDVRPGGLQDENVLANLDTEITETQESWVYSRDFLDMVFYPK